MSLPVAQEQNYTFVFKNTTGGQLEIGTFVLVSEQFGNVVGLVQNDKTSPPLPVPNNEYMLVECAPARLIQIPDTQLDAGGTFAKDSEIYQEPGGGDIYDTPQAATRFVGYVTQALGSNNFIYAKTVQPIIKTT